jgi:hypothetical protein
MIDALKPFTLVENNAQAEFTANQEHWKANADKLTGVLEKQFRNKFPSITVWVDDGYGEPDSDGDDTRIKIVCAVDWEDIADGFKPTGKGLGVGTFRSGDPEAENCLDLEYLTDRSQSVEAMEKIIVADFSTVPARNHGDSR